MKYLIIPPPDLLKAYVKYFCAAEVEAIPGQVLPLRTIVEDSSGIIFHHQKQVSALERDAASLPVAMLFGQTTKPFDAYCKSSFSALGVMFYPHAITELFGVDTNHLTDQMIDLNHFINGDFNKWVMEAGSLTCQIQLITDLLTKKVVEVKREDKLVKHSIQLIKANKGMMTLKGLLQYYRISERQFQRRFLSNIGVSPRHYLVSTRFQEAVNLLKSGKYTKLSDIAFDLNYTDQSHFIRQVNQLSGMSPRQLQEKLREGPVNLILQPD